MVSVGELHAGTAPNVTTKETNPKVDFWFAGPRPEVDQSTGLSYLSSHFIYVVVFILFTLGLYYMVGKKSTTYFLVLVLLGQLIIPGGTGAGISQLTQNFKIFKG